MDDGDRRKDGRKWLYSARVEICCCLEYEMELSDWIMATEIVILNQSDPHPV